MDVYNIILWMIRKDKWIVYTRLEKSFLRRHDIA